VKINSAVTSVGPAPDSGQPRATAARRPAEHSGSAAGDVAISPLSAKLQEIEASLGNEPVVNAQRVAEIKQAIAEGRFKIDSEKIADGLLNSVRQMLAKDR
jgi:negative regulator of flagellin synthesis FlgM